MAVVHEDPTVEEAMQAVLAGAPAHVGEGLAGSAAVDQRSIVLNDLPSSTVAVTTPPQFLPFVQDHPMRAVMIVPLVLEGRLLGTIGAIRTRPDVPFRDDDLARLERMAARAAEAIADAEPHQHVVGPADHEAVFLHHLDGVLIIVPDGQVLAANPAACALLRMSEPEIRAAGRAGIVVPEHRLDEGLALRSHTGHARGELTFRRGDGSTFPVDVATSTYVTPDHETRAIVAVQDITAEVESRRSAADQVAALEEAAGRDPLTGLLNRRGFVLAAGPALAAAERHRTPCAVLFLDMDGLKERNDLDGHASGDAALRALAQAVVGTVRDEDVAARLGGDEFVVLLVDVGEDALPSFVERLEEAIDAAAPDAPISASIGAAVHHPGDAADLHGLIDAADRAMYQEKVVRRLLNRRSDRGG